MKNILLPIIITAISAGGLGFFAGTKYQASKTPSTPQLRQFTGPNGQTPRGNFNFRQSATSLSGASMIRGQILSIEGDTVTIALPDGGSQLILVSETTTITTASEGTVGDLKPEDSIMVFGESNDDGSVTAETISTGGRFGSLPSPTE